MLNNNTSYVFSLPLSELLSLAAFKGCTVLGGAEGLDRPVIGINLTDTPDYYNWINSDELMVTTCYGIRDDAEALRDFIRTLASHGLAGVCIKPHRFIDEIPPAMIRAADDLKFPLIELPSEVNFIDITKSVFEALMRNQGDMLRHILSLNDMLVRMIVEGADLDRIAQMLSELVGNSVLIIDTLNNRSASYITEASSPLFAEGGRYDLVTGGAMQHLDEAYSLPLQVDDNAFGYIYVFETDAPLTSLKKELVAQLARTIPLEIVRVRSVEESESNHFKDFLLHLFNDKLSGSKKEHERAKANKLELDDSHIVMRLSVQPVKGADAQNAFVIQQTLLYNSIKSTMENLGISCKMIKDENQYVLLFSSHPNNAMFSNIAKQFGAVISSLNKRFPDLLVIAGYGRPSCGLEGPANSNREAKIAYKVCSSTEQSKNAVIGFADIGLYRLIYSNDPPGEIRTYIQETIGKLLDSEASKSAEFISILDSYFRNYGNLKKVSEETFTHYNTVIYRLKRISEITGLDVRSPADRFQMETALQLYKLISIDEDGKDSIGK